jgi:hypothetical protein
VAGFSHMVSHVLGLPCNSAQHCWARPIAYAVCTFRQGAGRPSFFLLSPQMEGAREDESRPKQSSILAILRMLEMSLSVMADCVLSLARLLQAEDKRQMMYSSSSSCAGSRQITKLF